MNTRTTRNMLRLLSCVAAIALVMAAGTLRAQITCKCDNVTILVEKEVNCSVTLYFAWHGGSETHTYAAGTLATVPCHDDMQIALLDCSGRNHEVPPGGCVININAGSAAAAPGCCVDACLQEDAAGCWQVLVRRTISMAPGCFCQ